MIKRRILLSLLIFTVFTANGAITGCDDNYKTFALEEGFCHFSFQYPSRYRWETIDLADYSNTRFISIYFHESHTEESSSLSYISVSIRAPSEREPDYRAGLESHLEGIRTRPEYQLLIREPIMVDGRQGEMIVYSYRFPRVDGPTKFEIGAFSDYGGYIWSISMSYLESNSVEAKTDFEHILETFNILWIDKQ